MRRHWRVALGIVAVVLLGLVYAPWPLVPIPPLGIPMAVIAVLILAVLGIVVPLGIRDRARDARSRLKDPTPGQLQGLRRLEKLGVASAWAVGGAYLLGFTVVAIFPPLMFLPLLVILSAAPLDGSPVEYQGSTYYVSQAFLADPRDLGDARRVVAPMLMTREVSRQLNSYGEDSAELEAARAAALEEAGDPSAGDASAEDATAGDASAGDATAGAAPPAQLPCPALDSAAIPEDDALTTTSETGVQYVVIAEEPPCVARVDGARLIPLTAPNVSAEPYALVAAGRYLVLGLGGASGGSVQISTDDGRTWTEPQLPDGIAAEVGADDPLFLHSARVARTETGESLVLELGLPRWSTGSGESRTVEVVSTDGGRAFARR